MIEPYHYGFAAQALYGDQAPALTITDDGVFLTSEDEVLTPAPQDILDLALELSEKGDVPKAVSDRQFFQALYKQGFITIAELKAAVKFGDIPSAFQVVIDAIPPSELPGGMTKDDIEVLVMGATTYERNHPVSKMIASSFGWSNDDADDFWRFAASL